MALEVDGLKRLYRNGGDWEAVPRDASLALTANGETCPPVLEVRMDDELWLSFPITQEPEALREAQKLAQLLNLKLELPRRPWYLLAAGVPVCPALGLYRKEGAWVPMGACREVTLTKVDQGMQLAAGANLVLSYTMDQYLAARRDGEHLAIGLNVAFQESVLATVRRAPEELDDSLATQLRKGKVSLPQFQEVARSRPDACHFREVVGQSLEYTCDPDFLAGVLCLGASLAAWAVWTILKGLFGSATVMVVLVTALLTPQYGGVALGTGLAAAWLGPVLGVYCIGRWLGGKSCHSWRVFDGKLLWHWENRFAESRQEFALAEIEQLLPVYDKDKTTMTHIRMTGDRFDVKVGEGLTADSVKELYGRFFRLVTSEWECVRRPGAVPLPETG